LDFSYMQMLRQVANEVKPDFWLMGEVIHGDYIRWVNGDTLHCVTNYHLHKALYSGHNDRNYFEIAHTVKRLYEMGGNRPDGLKLYNFADNHDVERIYTKLNNKNHFVPVHILMYSLPGIPSVYYGSEFGIEGKKEYGSDDSLRPAISYEEYIALTSNNDFVKLISRLGKIRTETKALSYGAYKELLLTNCQYAFSREYNGQSVIVAVNNSDSDFMMSLPSHNVAEYVGGLTGEKITVKDDFITFNIKANSGEIWIPAGQTDAEIEPIQLGVIEKPEVSIEDKSKKPEAESRFAVVSSYKLFEEMTVEELQAAILERMKQNGPVTEQMKKDVSENVYHDSLVTWIKSFN